jgi:hypothetical protein
MARDRANVIAPVDDARANERVVTIYEPDSAGLTTTEYRTRASVQRFSSNCTGDATGAQHSEQVTVPAECEPSARSAQIA